MAYATINDVKAYLKGVDLGVFGTTTEQDGILSTACDVATTKAERFTRRIFASVTETRAFNGTGGSRLFLPDLLTLTAWSMDGEARDVSKLLRYPLSSFPTLWVALKDGVFTEGEANVEITGSWGYSASAPASITGATAMLAAADVLSRLSPSTDAGAIMVSQGALSQRYDGGAYGPLTQRLVQMAEGLLSLYKRPVLR